MCNSYVLPVRRERTPSTQGTYNQYARSVRTMRGVRAVSKQCAYIKKVPRHYCLSTFIYILFPLASPLKGDGRGASSLLLHINLSTINDVETLLETLQLLTSYVVDRLRSLCGLSCVDCCWNWVCNFFSKCLLVF